MTATTAIFVVLGVAVMMGILSVGAARDEPPLSVVIVGGLLWNAMFRASVSTSDSFAGDLDCSAG